MDLKVKEDCLILCQFIKVRVIPNKNSYCDCYQMNFVVEKKYLRKLDIRERS